MALFKNKTANRALYVSLGLLGIVIFLTFFIIPLIYRWCPSFIRGFIFQPDDEVPENVDYKNPENSGFIGARNFYLTTLDGAQIGVWHTLPESLEGEAKNLNLTNMDEERAIRVYNDWMADGTVFLYLHGSAGTRTSPHRLRVYRLLNKLNYHVIAFDYRGYGDSTSSPMTESDLVEDTMTVFNWLQERISTGNVFFWGHSLGTGVSAHVADKLESMGYIIDGMVLEAPFNNVADVFRDNSLLDSVSFLPWFEYCFIQPLYDNDLSFESDTHLRNVSTPVLILHAKDDKIVSYELAAKLYNKVALSRKDPTSVQMVGYDSSLGYGHYNIALDPNLNITVSKFVDKYEDFFH